VSLCLERFEGCWGTDDRSEEAKRRDAVMNHVQFKSDPWATIRMHAGNSLAVKEAQAPKTKKAQATGAKKGGMDLD
jgi:hypothetical protein